MDHAIVMARPKGVTPQRATGLIFAGLLQVALIFALVEGLNIKVWPTREPTTSIEIIKGPSKPGPQPPTVTTWHEPTISNPIVPTFQIDNGQQGQGITIIGPMIPSNDRAAVGVADTHTTPPYPLLAIRLGEEGNVHLRLTISAQGVVTDAVVVRSSGYGDLDQAARDWILAHWRYQPATHGGVAVASVRDIEVRFDLKNAH
jgi:protein TonB